MQGLGFRVQDLGFREPPEPLKHLGLSAAWIPLPLPCLGRSANTLRILFKMETDQRLRV